MSINLLPSYKFSFLDSPGIGNPALIENLQEKAQTALEDYLRNHSSTHFSSRYGKLLLRLPALSLLRPGTIESMFFPDLFGENTIDSFVGSVLVCSQQISNHNNNNESLLSFNMNDNPFAHGLSSSGMNQQFELFTNNQNVNFIPADAHNLHNSMILNSMNEIQMSNLPNMFQPRGSFGDLGFGVSPAALPNIIEGGGGITNGCDGIFNQVLPDQLQKQGQDVWYKYWKKFRHKTLKRHFLDVIMTNRRRDNVQTTSL